MANTNEDLIDFLISSADQMGVPANLALSLAHAESSLNPNARGPVTRSGERAVGMFQLMPGTAKQLGVNAEDPYENILGGLEYLRRNHEKLGAWDLAVAAHHAGPGAVMKAGGIPNTNDGLSRTADYVKKIMAGAGDIEAALTGRQPSSEYASGGVRQETQQERARANAALLWDNAMTIPSAQTYSETPVAKQSGDGDFVRSVKNYLPQLNDMLGGIQTLGGEGLRRAGFDDIGNSLIESGLSRMKSAKSEIVSKPTDELTGAWEKGIGSVITDWLPYQIGQGVGNLAEMGLTAGAGAAVGSAIGGPVAPATAATGFMTGLLTKSLAKKGVLEAAEKIAKDRGEDVARDFVKREAGKLIGTNAGMAAAAIFHGAGETGTRVVDEANALGLPLDQIDLGRFAVSAAGHAALEFIGNKVMMGAFAPLENAAGKGMLGLTKSVSGRVAATGFKEMPVEIGQTGLERFAAGLPLANSDAQNEYINAAGAAMAMGIVPGGAGGAYAHIASQREDARLDAITQAEQTKQAAQAAIATAPTVDAAVEAFNVANAAGSASIVDQSALLNELTGSNGIDASIATADADAQALQAGIRDIDQQPTTLGERVSESGIPMGVANAPQISAAPTQAEPTDLATIKTLQADLAKAEPFSEQSSTITDKLHTAVHADAQSSLDAGEMPVYRVTDHVSVALHPSAQKEGMIQVTRYTKDGVIGDSQYNSVEEAIRNEGLIDRQRIDSAEAVKMIEQSIAAEADYRKRKSAEPIQPAIQTTQQQGSTAAGAIQQKPDLPEVTTVVPTFTPAAPPVAKSIKNWSANELQARLDRAASGESPLSPESEKVIRAELATRPVPKATGATASLSIGSSPNSAEPVSVRGGVVYVGDYPAMDYETEADITVPDGATPQQIVAALRKGGAIASSSKVFGLAKAEKSDPLPKVDRKQIDPAKDSLFVAIAKLGGMDTQELLSNGFDQNDITYEVAGRVSKEGAKTGNYTKNTGRLGKKKRMPRMLGFNMPLHRNGGISFDGMLEALKQHGYFPEGATKNDAIEAFSRELGGEQVLTPEAVEAEMEAAQAARDAEIKASDEYDAQSDFEAETAAEIRAINAGYDALLEDEQAFVRGLKKHGASDEEINGYIAEFKRVREGNDAGAETSQSDSGTRSSEESDLHGESLGGKEGQAPEWLSTKRSEFRLEGQTNEQASEQKKEPELTKEQIDRERDGTPFTLEQESQPKPMGSQGSLFARQITADDKATVTNVADADLPANVKQTAAFLRVMARILGKKIQWVSGANFDGMVKDSDTIYLNVDGDTNKVAVFGHEFWHQVEMTHKAVFDAVLKVVDPMFDLKQATQMFNDYYSKNASEAEVSAWLKEKNEQLSAQQGKSMTNRDFLIREFLSDTTGNRFTESDFWGDVFAKLEQREGHLKAVTLIRRFVKSLTDALNKLTNVLKMQGFRTDNDLTVEQIGRVKSALSEGMAQYLQDTRYGTKANGTVASGAKYSTQKDFTPDAELTAAAKKHFMLTMDVKEAGYIMPDGSMLDFSGKHYSSRSNWPYLRGQRNVDHRELTSENTHTNSTLESYFKTNDGNDIMEEFMSRTGAMRVDFNAGVSSIMRAPTDVQLKKLGQMKGWSATSYIDPDNGRIVADVEWDNTTPAKIRTFFAENVGKKAGDTAPKFSPMRTEITAVPMRSDEVAADKDNSHEYRLAVEKIAKERYASKPPVPVTINTTNEVVFISWGSASHILRDGLPDWKTSLAVLHMEGLIKSAERSGEFVPDYKGRKDPNGMYPYHSEAMIDGERHDVDITVRVHSDGHRYYDHIVVAKKTPAGLLESGDGLANSDAPTPPFTGADSNVAPDTPNNKYSPQRRFYSQLERTVEQTPDRIFATAPQFKLWLLANAGKFGIDKNELRESDFIQWLDEQKKVTKEEVKAKVSEGLPLFSRQRAKISDMADKDTVAGTQAPTSAGDESTGSAKQQIRIIPKWAAGEVYLRNADLRSHISLGPNNIFIRDDGRAIIDGNTVSPGDKLYLNSENKFVKEASAEDREKIAESLRYRIDQLVKESEGINRSVAKSSPSQSSGIDSGFDIFSENFRDPDEWKYARYPNARRGYAMDLLGLEAVDAISDKHDPEAIKQYVVDQYLRDKVFKVGGYLHIDDGQQVDGRLANAIYAYRAMGGRIGKSVLDAIGDKSYIKTYDLDPNEGVSIKDASDLSNVTELKPRNKPNEPSASAGSDVNYSTQRTAAPNVIPEETKAQLAQRKAQDKLNRFTVIKDWLKEQGVVLSEQADVYKAEERMHSRFANKVEDFRTKLVEPLIKKIQAAGFSMDDVSLFLHAQHAEERNNQIAKINPKQPDGGSGMTTADANNVLAAAPAELKALANEFRQITEMTKHTLLDSGIVSQDMVDAWEGAYSNYIPLKGGPDEKASKTGTGKGLHVNGKMKRALGHGKREGGEWIVENILADYERAVMLAEKNRVGHHLVKMALEVGRDDLITIGKPEKRAVLRNDSAYEVRKNGAVIGVFNSQEAARVFKTTQGGTGITITKTNDPSVIYSASPMLQDNEANVYINGHAVRVQINDDLLARAYKNLGSEAMPEILKAGRMLNNYLSKAYTGYNPEFILTNIVRDFTTGLINVTGEEGAVFAAKSAGNYLQSFGQMLKYAVTGQESRWIKDYRADGGNTGAAYLSDLERLGKEVQTEYATYKGVIENLKAKDGMGAARAAGRHAFNWSLKWIEHLNQAGENAMRLAIYRTAIESGKTRAEAASLSKNSTVNFNRKGEWGQNVNALYLFFNAGVQGTASLAHAHFKGEHKYQAWALSSAMVGLGYMVAAAFGGGDEDDYDRELSDYDKSRNLVIRAGDSWVKIPVPYGYGFFYNLGRHFADSDRKGEWGKMPWDLASDFVGEFTPFGGVVAGKEADSKQLVFALPTAAQIPGAVAVNRTGMGSSIFPENPFDKSMPDNLKMWRNTKGSLSDDLAQTLTGVGLEVSPETLKHLGRTATGGFGAFIGSVFEAGDLKMKGADLEVKEMPFVRKFVKEGSVSDYRSAFYEARSEASKAADDFARAKKMGDMMSAQRMARDNAELIAMDKYADSLSKMIKAKRDAQDAIKNDERFTVAEKRLKLKVMEAEEKKVYDRYLDIFKKRTDQRRERLDKAA